jgi:hypothetical protein
MIIWGNGIIGSFQKWKLEVIFQSFLSDIKRHDLKEKYLNIIFWGGGCL